MLVLAFRCRAFLQCLVVQCLLVVVLVERFLVDVLSLKVTCNSVNLVMRLMKLLFFR